jgi:hypothetical protein
VTTSPETDALNHPVLRDLVQRANELPLPDRVALLKALIPAVARDMTPREYEGLVAELRLKGERLYAAITHPGQGRQFRHVMGERDLEKR